MDQTGVHLVPTSRFTYEMKNTDSVAVIGAEDERQITACLASSMHGDLLPLQLIFQGKTDRSHPGTTPASIAARVDVTHSDNHWSTQETMQRYIKEVIMPHVERSIQEHRLHSDAKVLLLLDAWAVHKSEEFRRFLRTHHPRIHLVFVPPNCTSKLQVADVVLQRGFKSGITHNFNQWAATEITKQIGADAVVGVAKMLKMKQLKPLVLQWCIDSWEKVKLQRELITGGWITCVSSYFNVNDPAKRVEAMAAVAKKELELMEIPEAEEKQSSEPNESDSEDELDTEKPRTFGKQSGRARKQAATFGYRINPSQIEISEDSD
jgi:hypothetical protein